MPAVSAPFERSLEKLEFEKIRNRVRRFIVSGLGESLLAECSPQFERRSLERQLAQITEVRQLLETEDVFPIYDVRDIRASLKRTTMENAALEPAETIDILYTLRASRALHAYFTQHKEPAPLLHALSAGLFSDKILERHIELTVDETGNVLDSASKRLRMLRTDIIAKQEQLRKRYAAILRAIADKEFTQDDIVTQRDGRMVIPVKTEHKRKVSGVVHSVSQTGQTVFVEPNEMLELNNEIVALQFEEQKEISAVLRELTGRIRAQLPALIETVEILKQLDFLHAKGRYSLEVRGTAPELSDGVELKIVGGRHPLLIAHHGFENVLPFSLELDGEHSTLVISGPNAGGKTVALKSIGLIVLLAQCGFHVPAAAGTVVPLCDVIFADIGDDQSVENDLSTFSSHLRNIKTIVEESTRRSLILMDELGSGTDPNEGGAFAMSVLAHLTRRGALTVVTTHHGALKAFAHSLPGALNAGMEFDAASLQPTYRLRVGIPGGSYAFEIAAQLNFPNDILDDARKNLGEQRANLETLLADLERALRDANNEHAEAAGERERLKKLTAEYEVKVHTAGKESREIVRKAKEESREMLQQSRALIENTVRELRESSAQQQQEIRRRFEQAKTKMMEKIQTPVSAAPQLNKEFHKGDRVRIAGSEVEGEIVSLSPESGTAEVQAGALKIKAKIATLERGASKQRSDRRDEISRYLPPETGTTIDIRGMYGDEAIGAVENFIAESVAASHERIEIIHGKGTGALRTHIHNLLRSHPAVLSFRLADWNAGGSGATVVELKR